MYEYWKTRSSVTASVTQQLYHHIFGNHYVSRSLDEFKIIVDGLAKISFRGCRRSIKRIFCKTPFNLCHVTKKNCVKEM